MNLIRGGRSYGFGRSFIQRLNWIKGDAFAKIVVSCIAIITTLRFLTAKQCLNWKSRFHSRQWTFKSKDLLSKHNLNCIHKVIVRYHWCQIVCIMADDHESDTIIWKQSIWDVLDFGGKFRFTITSPECTQNDKPFTHDCLLVVRPWSMKLYIDNINVETGKAYIPFRFRLFFRFMAMILIFFLVFKFIY
jgi:hypothetical protein